MFTMNLVYNCFPSVYLSIVEGLKKKKDGYNDVRSAYIMI